MRHAIPTGTLTFLFTDIEGSTQLLRDLGAEAYGRLLGNHHRLCRAAWESEGGIEVDTAGDAFFVVFTEAAPAVRAAAAAQDALEETGLRVRMGLHTGEVHLGETGYVGAEVHRAARIGASGHGGQVLLSGSTVAQLDALDGLVSLGYQRLKDFDEPVEVFQLGNASFPPLKTVANTNLPTPASSFVGREIELAEAGRLLAEARMVTVVGPGGAGKTRLAIELARRARETRFGDYRDGVFWVPLASLRDPALVPDVISKALGATDDLAAFIGTKRLLVLLDNLEQVLSVAHELSRLLAMCPHLTLLCTSRALLRIDGERDYDLRPLVGGESVALFADRSGLEPSPAVAELARRLDGLPLALELAAARARVLSVDQILERISDRLDLFRGGGDIDPRQATLRATMAWSYDLLDAGERRLFTLLSVFSGGCVLEAAEQICDANVDSLQSLLDKSLLHRRDDNGVPRFWMLETIREFGLEQLAESGEGATLRERHAEWYRELAASVDGFIWTTTLERVDLLERELDNFRSVLESAVRDGHAGRALEVTLALFPVWEMRDRLVEGDLWLERALALPGGDDVLRGKALGARCAFSFHLGRFDAARTFAREGVEILRVHGSEPELAMALLGASWALLDSSMPDALAAAEEALLLARRSGSPGVTRTTLHNLGRLEAQLGQFDHAALLLEEALQLSRDLSDFGHVVAVLHSLGDVELRRGSDAAARARFLEAGTLGVSEHVPQQVALCVGGLAAVAARQGRSDLARRLWASVEEWELRREAPLHPYERMFYETAVGHVSGGDREASLLTIEQAIELARENS